MVFLIGDHPPARGREPAGRHTIPTKTTLSRCVPVCSWGASRSEL